MDRLPSKRSAGRTSCPVFALVLLVCLSVAIDAELCDIESGQSNVILDIEESRGPQTNQSTRPKVLPIVGDVPAGEISLTIASSSNPNVFALLGKELKLTSPLDRDHQDISSVILQVSCTNSATGRRRNIPVIVRISDVNDKAPVFLNSSYSVTIPEDLPVGGIVIRDIEAKDADAGINALVEYKVVPNSQRMRSGGNVSLFNETNPALDAFDGFGMFEFPAAHIPVMTLRQPIDYESVRRYLVTIVASDRALNAQDRLSSTATLTVKVSDVEDQPPAFQYVGCPLNDRGVCITPNYTTTIISGVTSGLLTLKPDRILALDTDPSSLAPIRYTFDQGSPPNFREYFEINPNSGWVKQIKPANRSVVNKFDLIVKAEEMTSKKRSSSATLSIEVGNDNNFAPRLVAEALEGFVDENSPVGTPVISARRKGQPLQLKVVEEDSESENPLSQYEIELTSPAFRVNKVGIMEVAVPNLDRDAPNPSTLTFQAIARKAGGATTSPIAISIRILDVNDNAPRFPSFKPVFLQAGDSKKVVTQVQAEDKDWADNGRIEYAVVDVTNNGKNKFVINPQTGVIDSSGALKPGEKFTLTLQATDGGGKSSLGLLEVIIIPGPNIQAPVFTKDSYEISVDEGSPVNSLVYTFQARDQENDRVTYSIVAGNELGHFKMEKSNGSLLLAKPIDREQLSRYVLTVRAEDTGGLSSVAQVMVRVLDTNDRSPEFIDLPYIFRVKENDLTGYIGRVHAKDADIEKNGQITYFLPADENFVINSQTGELKSKAPLDYEKDRVHLVVIAAQDNGLQPRVTTATATVVVLDFPDERPKFSQQKYESDVPENIIDFFVAQVQATDMDSESSVTYTIRQGDAEKFRIDPQSGIVRTRRSLDYERQAQYVLIIGTLENTDVNDPQATTTLFVNVQDRNDVAPVYSSLPRPVRLRSTVPVGQVVTTVIAVDSDGTSPNNHVRYELVNNSNKVGQFFRINPESGVISTRDSLRKDNEREYKLRIRAYDLGKPTSLSTLATVIVLVDHVAPLIQPDVTHMSFSEMTYSVSVAEDALANTLIKNLSVINRTNDLLPVSCEIVSGNSEDAFYMKESADRNCELRLKKTLDFEATQRYEIEVQLKTSASFVNQDRSTVRVDVTVLDVNDNSPKFLSKYPENRFTNGKFYAAISADAPISSVLILVAAEDADSGPLGQLVYDIMEETNSGKLFNIDKSTGTIHTEKMMSAVRQLPIRLIVTARDNPGQPVGYRETNCQVVVNIIEPQHRLVLVLPNSSPDQVHRSQSSIIDILQEETKMIVRVEKLQALTSISPNGTILVDPSGSELWFYCVDPTTETIVLTNHSQINSTVLEMGSTNHLAYLMATKLKLDVSEIRQPLDNRWASKPYDSDTPANRLWNGFPAALVVVGVLVFLLALGGIVYICASWDRLQSNTDKRVQPYVVFPPYNPVVIDPNPKEYETQILQLSVNNSTDDSESSGDHNMDYNARRNRVFPLAVPTYISGHHINGALNSANADIATLRFSSLAGMGHCEFAPHQFFPEQEEEDVSSMIIYDDPPIPTTNPLYEGSDEDPLNFTSATNANVTFRSKLQRFGIPEVSTEL
ncbi:cadherin-99C-like isoform X2 [Daphnia pulicaria]|uniref:cadherin-99C-like isoform X2 n=1 Tax=Daphnia pulicaria TaxID=35523 RepID=UPI001EEB89A6|nr:cadherin-99C-like isoform X2 [Daphnia pulicaria]